MASYAIWSQQQIVEGWGGMRAIMIGIWVMTFAILSTFLTIPLGYGVISGTVFVLGMLFSWVVGLFILAKSAVRWFLSKLDARQP
jgi:hypothetical protein